MQNDKPRSLADLQTLDSWLAEEKGILPNLSGIEPTDVKVLFYPDPVEERTAGGIIRPDMTKDKEQYATVKGTLVAVGPNAFREWGAGAGPKAGSRVITAQYAGLNIDGADSKKYRLCNDEDIIGVLSNG